MDSESSFINLMSIIHRRRENENPEFDLQSPDISDYVDDSIPASTDVLSQTDTTDNESIGEGNEIDRWKEKALSCKSDLNIVITAADKVMKARQGLIDALNDFSSDIGTISTPGEFKNQFFHFSDFVNQEAVTHQKTNVLMIEGLLETLKHCSENAFLLSDDLRSTWLEHRKHWKEQIEKTEILNKQYHDFKKEVEDSDKDGNENDTVMKKLQKLYKKYPKCKGIEMQVGKALKDQESAKISHDTAYQDYVASYEKACDSVDIGVTVQLKEFMRVQKRQFLFLGSIPDPCSPRMNDNGLATMLTFLKR